MLEINKVINYFDELYESPECALNFSTPYELLIAVILSAQCTDKRVNVVTEKLFKLANTPQKMLELGEAKIKEIIHSCGFYNAKSKAILESSLDIINKFNGEVPKTMEDLTSLRGVGRKTANVVLGNAFGEQTIAVDTHVHRISKRLGITKQSSTPTQCEMDLIKIVPYEKRTKFHHQAIWFGREHCKAINPQCSSCKLNNICKYYKKRK